ncbi:MAG: hypothetical protein JO250_17645 [Armatimonadetes bacterium]|nr:hypothetical protein [Armatimonadota bacterium]
MEHIKYEGWKDCVRLANGAAELVVTAAFGPRIIHYGRTGGPNAFHVIPETRGQIGSGKWFPYGGHRLWHAPEVMPRTYQPDNEPPDEVVEMEGGGLRVGNWEAGTGLFREMRIMLAPQGTAARVEHRLINHNLWAITLAPWGLSIVANGGRAVIPQEPFVSHDDDLTPARPLVLWKFTDMADPRWRWGRKYLSLRQEGDEQGNPQKVGVYNAQGWAAHLTPQQAFLIAIDVAPGGPSVLPDDGCNFETYTDGPFQELETLGPLQTLEPGQHTLHTEHWFLAPTQGIADEDAALDAQLLPLVAQAREAWAALR